VQPLSCGTLSTVFGLDYWVTLNYMLDRIMFGHDIKFGFILIQVYANVGSSDFTSGFAQSSTTAHCPNIFMAFWQVCSTTLANEGISPILGRGGVSARFWMCAIVWGGLPGRIYNVPFPKCGKSWWVGAWVRNEYVFGRITSAYQITNHSCTEVSDRMVGKKKSHHKFLTFCGGQGRCGCVCNNKRR